MNNQQKIDFNQTRKFGDKINITFNYISQNFKSLLLSLIYILAPILLLGGIVYAYFFDWYFGFIGDASGGNPPDLSVEELPVMIVTVVGLILVSIFAVTLIVSVLYSHMMIYKETDLHRITVNEVWERVKKEFSGILGVQIIIFLLFLFGGAVIGGLLIGIPIAMESFGLAVLGYFILFILAIYAAITISLSFIIKVNEHTDVFTAIQRSFYLIKGKWWSTFGLLFIMQMIAGMMSYIFAIPMYAVMVGDMLHSIESGGAPFESYEGMGPLGIVFTTIYVFGAYILYALPFIAIAFQYYNLVELKEATGLMDKIDTIGAETDTDDADEVY
jgi:hypothetical protein